MKGYVIAIRYGVSDPEEMAAYSKAARAVMPPNMKFIARYGRSETLEGPPSEGAALIEFPTYAEAKAWYEGAGYTQARQHRLRGANYQLVLVEGV